MRREQAGQCEPGINSKRAWIQVHLPVQNSLTMAAKSDEYGDAWWQYRPVA